MDQQQFKIRMSVSTKMLLTISFLLTTPIFFLNISAINLFQNDKKSYVYDSQATSAALAGREFVSYLDTSLNTLKLVLGSVDLTRPISEQVKNQIKFYLDNQNSLLGIELHLVNRESKLSAAPIYRYAISENAETKFSIDSLLISQHYDELLKNGYFFTNITRQGSTPLLVIGFAANAEAASDGTTKPVHSSPATLSVALGVSSLDHFASGATNSFNIFMIAKRTGELLFHSDLKSLDSKASIANEEIFRETWNSSVNAGAKEYYSTQGTHMLGSYYKPGLGLAAISVIDYNKAMKATYTLTEKFIVLGIAALGFMIVLGLIFSKRLTAPLHRLFQATNLVSAGNFNIQLPISSNDEIGALTNSFMTMSHKISELLQNMVDKVRIDQEFEIAKTVQQSLFPPSLIKDEHIDLASHYQSASECGGDWWGHFRVGSRHIIAIADATGHGLPSALITASARSCFSVIEKLMLDSQFNPNPAQILDIANRVVYDSAHGKIMMTCFVCVLDFDNRVISYSSAAHNPPWLFSPAMGSGSKVSSLVATGQRLGEARETVCPYELRTMSFRSQDTLVLYTDGLLEGKNKRGDQYGKKQPRTILEDTVSRSPQEMIQILMNDFLAHNQGKPLDDDVTLAILRILS